MKSMQHSAERVVLECRACGGRTVLGGPEEVWISGPTDFGCGGAGEISPSPTASIPPYQRSRTREGKDDKAGPATARTGWVAAGG
jgi:hypothetical protein